LVPIHTETTAQADSLLLEENGRAVPDPVSEVSVLDIAVLMVRNKRFIMRFVLGAIVLAIVVALLLPVSYEAQVVLLPPAGQSSSIASALLGQLGNLGSLGPLSAVAGGLGMKTPTDMYVSLLKSRTVEDATIQRFGLMAEYRVKRLSEARKVFEHRANVVAGQKDGLIRITVEDHDAKRASELANGYVEEFKKLSASLAITEAARRRLFFEQQLQPAREQLAVAEEAMRKTQQSTGVLQIDSQARALIESTAMLRAQVVAKEVQIQGMRSFATEDNPELVLARQQFAALQSQLEHLAGSREDTGSDIVLSKGRVTGAGLEYLRRYRELKYHEAVYELLTQELEIARLDEAREGELVQVVDPAVTPDKKSSPQRTLIVIGMTILAFFVAVFWIIVRQGLERAFRAPENRERMEAIKYYWKGKQGSI
jgi:uncharacterized protein involved in exopolysaccharide biosynthesis